MDQLIKIDIFFFITTLAVVLVTVIFSIVLIYVVRILQDVRYISKRAREGVETLVQGIEGASSFVKEEGEVLKKTLSFFYPIKSKPKKRKVTKKSTRLRRK